MQARRRHARQRGFSSFEAMMPLSLAAVLAVALPVGGRLLAGADRAGAVNTVLAALRSARQLSEETGRTVTVCPAAPAAQACGAAAQWGQGMMAFADLDRDGQRGAGERVLWHVTVPAAGLRISSDRGRFSFTPLYVRGADIPNTEGYIRVCDPADPAGARTIEVGPRRRAQLVSAAPRDTCDPG